MFLFTKIRNSLSSRKLNSEIQQEMETHVALLEEEACRTGLSTESARAEARRRFGRQGKHFDSIREVSVSTCVSELEQDMRFTMRQMRRNRGFTAVAILVIGLGIGAVTTIFSLVDAVLIHSLPYGHPERLVYLWTRIPGWGLAYQRK